MWKGKPVKNKSNSCPVTRRKREGIGADIWGFRDAVTGFQVLLGGSLEFLDVLHARSSAGCEGQGKKGCVLGEERRLEKAGSSPFGGPGSMELMCPGVLRA